MLIPYPNSFRSKFGEKELSVLSDLFQSYFNSNTVTDNLTGMNLTQAFEKNDNNHALNYQPISLVYLHYAPLEHNAASNMMHFLEESSKTFQPSKKLNPYRNSYLACHDKMRSEQACQSVVTSNTIDQLRSLLTCFHGM